MQPPQEPTIAELQAVEKMKEDLSDLCLDKWHLETKNLVRFLRARNHSLDKAIQLFKEQVEWRQKYDIDHILEWEVPTEYKIWWPWNFTGWDVNGNPMRTGIWDHNKVGQVGYQVFLRYLFHMMESIYGLVRKESEGLKTMKQFTVIDDLKELSWKMVTTIDAMRAVLELFRCGDKYYPEILHMGYVVNAPFVFGYAWKLIKPLISEHNQSRVLILKGSKPTCWMDEFSKVMSKDQLPWEYGGELHYDTDESGEETCT